MLSESRIYRHSGKLGSGLTTVPLIGILSSVVLAIVYAYLDVYIPYVGYISFVLTAGFALALGVVVSRAAVKANCRNVAFVRATGFVVGIIALYFAWVAFLYALLNLNLDSDQRLSPIRMVLDPAGMWGAVARLGEHGYYSLGGKQIQGTELWIVWGLEALIIVGGVVLLSTSGIAHQVFCERCMEWCNSLKGRMRLAVSHDERLYQRLACGDVAAMAAVPVVDPLVSPYIRVDLHRCPKCSETAVWQALLVTHQRNNKGELQQKEAIITPRRFLSQQEAMELDSLAARPPIELPDEGS